MASWLFLILVSIVPGDTRCTILEFTADWCLPCKEMLPALGKLSEEGWDVRQVNIDRYPDLVRRFQVTNLPTLVILDGDQEADRIVGVTHFDQIKKRALRVAARGGSLRPSSVRSSSVRPSLAASTPENLQPQPIVRGQSPSGMGTRLASSVRQAVTNVANLMSQPSQQAISKAGDATVRIRVDEGTTTAFGTGTIVDLHGTEALVLTCGHLFRDMTPGSRLSVELFAGTPRRVTVSAQLVDFSAEESDIGLLSCTLPVPIEPVVLLPRGEAVRVQQPAFSFGCDHGADPSLRKTNITHINRYLGTANIEIAGAPAVGRSGGGLFDSQGRLIGVCNAADQEGNEGIYAGPEVIYAQLARLDLVHLFEPNSPGESRELLAQASENSGPSFRQDQPDRSPSQMDWPDKSMAPAKLGNLAANGLALNASNGSAENAETSQVIVIVKSASGETRMMTIDSPSADFVDQIQRQANR